MGARTVAVRLTAEVGSFVQGLRSATAATRDLHKSTLDTAAKNKDAFQQIGVGAAAIGTLAAAGVVGALKSFADFDAAMSNVQAATHESAAAMGQLREAALEAGARTAFSATEAAGGIEALAKAGVSTASILNGGLNGALDLAAAGGLNVADAAEIAATAMTQFSLAGDQVPHVADLLAAAAGKAQGEVSDMGQALKQAGLVAAQTGLSIEETTAGLASFASAGLLGSDAGTSFKSMLQRLTPQSQEAADLMERLGISAYDAQGNFIGLEGFAGNLQESLSGLTVEQRNSAMATIFGSDAVRAASVLYSQGADGIASWTEKVNDAGYAQETASIKLDNLKGDIEAFSGSMETALIKTGAAGDGIARGIVQQATSVVNAYSSLPPAAQRATMGFGAVVAVAGAAAGSFLILAPRIAETRDALKTLSTEMPRTTGAMKGLGKAMGVLAVAGAAATGLAALARLGDDAAPSVDKLTRSLLELESATASGELARTFGEDLDQLGASIRRVTDKSNQEAFLDLGNAVFTLGQRAGDDKLIKARDQLTALDASLSALVSNGQADVARERFAQLASAALEGGASVEEFRRTLPGYTDALAAASTETAIAADAEGEMGGAVAGATGEIQTQSEKLGELMTEIRALSDLVLGMRSAEREFQAAVDEATASVKENGRTLDINSEKGRANEAALDAIASSANDVLEAMVASGAPIADVSKKMGTQRERLIAAAEGFGMTRDKAKQYADMVLRIPTKAQTTVALNGADAAMSKVELFRQKIANIPSLKRVTVQFNEVLGTTVQRGAYAGRVTERASGGPFPPGALLVGEQGPELLFPDMSGFVLNNKATLEAMNAGRFASGGWLSGPTHSPAYSGGSSRAGEAPAVQQTNHIYGSDNIIEASVRQANRELAFALTTSS